MMGPGSMMAQAPVKEATDPTQDGERFAPQKLAPTTDVDHLIAHHLEGRHEQRSNPRKHLKAQADYHQTWYGKLDHGAREGAWGILAFFSAIRCASLRNGCASCNSVRVDDELADLHGVPPPSAEAEEPLEIGAPTLPRVAAKISSNNKSP